jgi:hypothetical protein
MSMTHPRSHPLPVAWRASLPFPVLALLLSGCGGHPAPAPPVFAKKSPGERGCLLANTCLATIPPSLGSCLTYVKARPEPSADYPSCVGAPTCAAYLDCVTLSHGQDYCAAHSGPSCDGNVSVTCRAPGDTAGVEDCGANGMRCELVDWPEPVGKQAICTTGMACGMPPVACAGPSAWTSCLDPVDREQKRACPTGTTCDSRALAGTPCVPEGDDCGPASSRCDGDVRVWCESYSDEPDGPARLSRLDCGRADSHCSAGSGGPQEARCVPAGIECTEDEAARCVGDRLQYCEGGRRDFVDCVAEGLARCRSGGPQREDHCE